MPLRCVVLTWAAAGPGVEDTVHAEVEKLLSLQDIDGRLEILRHELEARPRLLHAQETRLLALDDEKKAADDRGRQKKRDIDRLELDVKSIDEKILDQRKKIPTIKSNAEYTALLHQIEKFEQDKETLEEQLLEKWEEVERVADEHREIAAQRTEVEAVLADEKRAVEAELADVRREAGELVARRDELRGTVDPEILENYDRLFSRYRERSVVSAEGGVCTGCHMSLSPQILNELYGGREFVHCPNCTRIIYL